MEEQNVSIELVFEVTYSREDNTMEWFYIEFLLTEPH